MRDPRDKLGIGLETALIFPNGVDLALLVFDLHAEMPTPVFKARHLPILGDKYGCNANQHDNRSDTERGTQ